MDLGPARAPLPSGTGVIPDAPRTPTMSEAAQQPGALTPPSEKELRAIAEHLQAAVGKVDPDASIEVPPPSRVDRGELGAPQGAVDPYIGTTFDHRYKIEKLLGEGGMGFVYMARHKVIDKKVAIKVLRADLARDREILDRFLQEAKSASSIGNSHIIDISDFGDLPDGSTYFVMEYLEGKGLGHVMEETNGFDVERICNIALQIADGLAAAHERGIVHRDLKPDNIFLVPRGAEKDFVKILDFGIAKVSNGATNTKLTKAGAVFGTPHYMSPEQAAGAPIDHRTDIYSLGVILYELTAGQVPFNAENFMGILTQHMYKAPVPIRALVPTPDCPPGLEALILKCLSKKPDARYASMQELSDDLEKLKRGEVPAAVNEMIARSGGFNVPHDFFKAQKAVVPATPVAPRKAWPRYVWVAGALSAIGLVTAIIVKGNTGDAHPIKPEGAAAQAPATAAPASAAPAATAPEVKKTAVALAVQPDSAVAYRDGQPLKMPAVVEVEDGKTVHLDIKADGYDSTSIDLDGKETSKTIKLTKTARAGGAPPPRVGPAKPPPPKGGGAKGGGRSGEVVDPW
jgi:serine/threonine-protein kinase